MSPSGLGQEVDPEGGEFELGRRVLWGLEDYIFLREAKCWQIQVPRSVNSPLSSRRDGLGPVGESLGGPRGEAKTQWIVGKRGMGEASERQNTALALYTIPIATAEIPPAAPFLPTRRYGVCQRVAIQGRGSCVGPRVLESGWLDG